MSGMIEASGLRIARELHDFVAQEALPGTGVDAGIDAFWAGFSAIVHDLAPKNRALLAKRDAHPGNRSTPGTAKTARRPTWPPTSAFLSEIGYLVAGRPGLSALSTDNVDPEIADDRRAAARRAGHECALCAERRQCPLGLALRRALRHRRDPRDRRRRKGQGLQSQARREGHRLGARTSSTTAAPLAGGSWADVTACRSATARCDRSTDRRDRRSPIPRSSPAIAARRPRRSQILLQEQRPAHRDRDRPRPPDRQDRPGRHLPTSCSKSALTTIMDCEDSVAAVDAEDKVAVYRNWLGLMKGDLDGEVREGRQDLHPQPEPRPSTIPRRTAARSTLPGRSLMLVRNVGHLMTNPAILDRDGNEVPEGIMDAAITGADRAARHRPERPPRRIRAPARSISSSRRCTGRRKSPSPTSCSTASRTLLGLAPNTIKMGIMDEERRTTVNLKECIRAAKRARRLHQHRLPRPHRRRDPHLDGSRPDDPQGRHEAGRLDRRL